MVRRPSGERSRKGTASLRAVIAMARSLDLGVVAEGLERAAQRDHLREPRCDEGQGFFLSPPLASADLELPLRRHGGRLAGDRASICEG